MSSQRILDAAARLFARQGYDATSMSDIASEVGIRKASIYSHFAGKKQLFLEILERVWKRELNCISLISTRGDLGALKDYIFNILERFEEDDWLLFWLRAIYLPPGDVREEISSHDEQFAACLDKEIHAVIKNCYGQYETSKEDLLIFSDACAGIIRGVHAELLYHGLERARIKAGAMWKIFSLALPDLERKA